MIAANFVSFLLFENCLHVKLLLTKQMQSESKNHEPVEGFSILKLNAAQLLGEETFAAAATVTVHQTTPVGGK